MFGRHKMYKKGMADAMSAYEAFSRKQEAALSHMREEIRQGNENIESELNKVISQLVASGDSINGIYDYLDGSEKAALLHLNPPVDIRGLDSQYKQFLLAVLFQLADNMHTISPLQKKYLRSLMKCLKIVNPQTSANLSDVGEIDSLDVQKAIYQVALEFFYLQDTSDFTESEVEFLEYFSVNKKQSALIEEYVSRFYNLMGADGLAEKYGDVTGAEIDFISKFFRRHYDESTTKEYLLGVKLFMNGDSNAEKVLKGAHDKGCIEANCPLYLMTCENEYLLEGMEVEDGLCSMFYSELECTERLEIENIRERFWPLVESKVGFNVFATLVALWKESNDYDDEDNITPNESLIINSFIYYFSLIEQGFPPDVENPLADLDDPVEIQENDTPLLILERKIRRELPAEDDEDYFDQQEFLIQLWLGVYLLKGIDVEKDEKLAFQYFSKAAAGGYIPAHYFLGCCYMKGQGVPISKEVADKHFSIACTSDYESVVKIATAMKFMIHNCQSDEERQLKMFF